MTLRLSAQLLETTWQQTQLSIDADIAKLDEWSVRFATFASQQSAMDFKFLNDRYYRGKKAIENYLTKKHDLVCVSSLTLGHSIVVGKQAELGAGARPVTNHYKHFAAL